MAVITDNFNRANGSVGANYTSIFGSLPTIASNKISGDGTHRDGFYTPTSIGADQYAQVVAIEDVYNRCGVWLRAASTGGGRGYLCFANTEFVWVQKYVGGANVNEDLAANSDTGPGLFYAEITGSSTVTIKIKIDGVLMFTYTDSSSPITSGQPGIYCVSCDIDDFEAGDLAGGGGGTATYPGYAGGGWF